MQANELCLVHFFFFTHIKVRVEDMSIYKEIVTKIVSGKGKKYFKNNYTLTSTDKPTTVQGCCVMNHLRCQHTF